MTAAQPTVWQMMAAKLEAEADGWKPYPWQISPGQIATQGAWLIEGGRGIGKTDGCARYVDEHVRGPACDKRIPGGHRIAIVAPTLDDAAESCVSGPSGLKAHNPGVVLKVALGGSKAIWPNGAEAKLFSGATEKDADRLRAGGNRCLVWVEEAAAIPWLGVALKQARYGLRIGSHPHIVASSTPRPTGAYKAFRAEPTTLRTHGTTEQAHHLNEEVRARLYGDYEGTRMGRQELLGELLEDVEGALWTLGNIDEDRLNNHPDLTLIAVSMDPAGDGGEGHDEHGLTVIGCAGRGPDAEFYVLSDLSRNCTPTQAARTAILTYVEQEADAIVYEKNQGQGWILAVLKATWAEMQAKGEVHGIAPPFRAVDAARSKRLRAEPVASLYEKHRVHHIGAFSKLEDQMTSWVPGDADSPDRLDALVHGVTWLYEKSRQVTSIRRPPQAVLPSGIGAAMGGQTLGSRGYGR
jgi:phage terminase large subunit-like protein